jgi:hypothetical protein
MNKQEELRLEMRLQALELVVAKQTALAAVTAGVTDAEYRKTLDAQVAAAGQEVFGVSDPALSDWASSEWEAANARLADIMHEVLVGFRQRLAEVQRDR